MRKECRDSGDSFHVDYTVAEGEAGQEEKVNLTRPLVAGEVVNSEEIVERGEDEYGWVAQLYDDGRVHVLVGMDSRFDGWDVEQVLTPETAYQLSDMFAKIAALSEKRWKPAPEVLPGRNSEA